MNVINGTFWLKKVVDRNIAVISKIELDVIRFKYGEIVNSSDISNGINEIDDVWNQSDNETVLDKKRIKSNRSLPTNDDKMLVVSRNSSNEQKHNFSHHQRKLNVSLNIFHEENTKRLDYFLVDNKQEPCGDSEPSAVVPEKLIMNIST